MNFSETRSSYSYIPDTGSLLEDGDLTESLIESTPKSILCVSSDEIALYIESLQYCSEKISFYCVPHDSYMTVSMFVDGIDYDEISIADSIEFARNTSESLYNRFCIHSETDIVPFAPSDGIVGVNTAEYSGIVSIESFEKSDPSANSIEDDSLMLSFVIDTSQDIKNIVRRFKNPACELFYESNSDTEEVSSVSLDAPFESVMLETDTFKCHTSFGSRRSYVCVNGKQKQKERSMDFDFPVTIFIEESCGSVFIPDDTTGYNKKIIVTKEEYNSLIESQKKHVVLESDVPDSCYQKHTSNEYSEDLIMYLYECLRQRYISFLQSRIPEDSQLVADLDSFTPKFLQFMFKSFSDIWDYSEYNNTTFHNASSSDLEDFLVETLGYTTETDLSEFEKYTDSCRRGEIANPHTTNKHSLDTTYVGVIQREAMDISGDVYMGVNLQPDKTKVLKQDSRDHLLVRLKNTSLYSLYAEQFGWKKQKDISESNISEFDISDELAEKFSTSSSSSNSKAESISDRFITVHSRSQSKNKKFSHLRSKAENSDEYTVVLFPRYDDENMSDYKSLATNDVVLCTPDSKSEVSYLLESEGVYKFPEYREAVFNTKFYTPSGLSKTIEEFLTIKGLGYTPIIHVINSVEQQLLDMYPSLITYIQENVVEDISGGSLEISDGQYVPLRKEKYKFIKPFLNEIDSKVLLVTPNVTLESFKSFNSSHKEYSIVNSVVDMFLEDEITQNYFSEVSREVDSDFIHVLNELSTSEISIE